MVRNRKVWGVLGLLLALVVVVGYGQQPPVGQPLAPRLVAVLTGNAKCASTTVDGRKLELFTRENDVHPVRNITYQNDPASLKPPLPRPDNPADCPGVVYFASDMGGAPSPRSLVSVYVNPGAAAGTYKFKICFRKSPADPSPNPIVDMVEMPDPELGALSQEIAPQPNDRCLCPDSFSASKSIPASATSANWGFKVSKTGVEFCRVEVWK